MASFAIWSGIIDGTHLFEATLLRVMSSKKQYPNHNAALADGQAWVTRIEDELELGEVQTNY